MARSPGFGSDASNSNRPLKTRFRYASTYRLKLARYTKSLTHYTKGTSSPDHQIARCDLESAICVSLTRRRAHPCPWLSSLRCGRAVALASALTGFGYPSKARQGRPAAAPYGAKAKRADARARRLRDLQRSDLKIAKRFGDRAPTDCRHPVSGSVSLPSSGCFSPFPHGTGSLSVAWEYLGLEGGPPMFERDCSCPALLKDHATGYRIRGCHPLWPAFPDRSAARHMATGLIPFRSPLLRESRLMSFPPGTEMFQFPGFASASYVFRYGYPIRGGLPHSEIHGSKPASRLPAAYRSVPRPSSPPRAKAFTRCP